MDAWSNTFDGDNAKVSVISNKQNDRSVPWVDTLAKQIYEQCGSGGNVADRKFIDYFQENYCDKNYAKHLVGIAFMSKGGHVVLCAN